MSLKGKTLPVVILFALTISICAIRVTNAQITIVSVKPTYLEVPELGQTFMIDINVTDVTNLFAYEIQLFYKRDIINATSAVRPPGHFLEPELDPNDCVVFRWEIENDFNATYGRIWLAFTLRAPETGRSGSGILARLTFNGTNVGTTPLILADDRGRVGQVLLAQYPDGASIANMTEDGNVNVIPEFPMEMILPLFLIALLTATAATNMTKSEKSNITVTKRTGSHI